MRLDVALGIDPGLRGGLALLTADERDDMRVVAAVAMPTTTSAGYTASAGKADVDAEGFAGLLRSWREAYAIRYVAVEKVHAMPKQGVTSMFNFGRGFGVLVGVLAGTGLRVDYVRPQAWKDRVFGDDDRGKGAAIAYCLGNYPSTRLTPKGCRKPHDGVAEALCLASYARARWLELKPGRS